MRYSNATDDSQHLNNRTYPMTYTAENGQETHYDLQQIRYDDGRSPTYIVSESALNQSPGFTDAHIRDGVSHEAASAAVALNRPDLFPDAQKTIQFSEVNLYQQRPDGNFEQVTFRQIGQDGLSNVDIERAPNNPQQYAASQRNQEGAPEQTTTYTESSRTLYTREELEKTVNAEIQAPEQTPQQQQDLREEQWKNLSGPSVDRAAEITAHQASEAPQQAAAAAQQQAAETAQQQAAAAAQQRSAEQTQQMNEHVQQQTR